nr:hypothetical protein [Tanacetum cinerariifolium]
RGAGYPNESGQFLSIFRAHGGRGQAAAQAHYGGKSARQLKSFLHPGKGAGAAILGISPVGPARLCPAAAHK